MRKRGIGQLLRGGNSGKLTRILIKAQLGQKLACTRHKRNTHEHRPQALARADRDVILLDEQAFRTVLFQ